MNCPTCRDLKRAYEAAFGAYIEARSSAWFSVSSKAAASKRVDLERTRYELEEHRIVCVKASKVVPLVPRDEQVYDLETIVA